MSTHQSTDWSNAHANVNDALAELLNALRDHQYNPSLHITYDRHEHHLLLDPVVLNKHVDVKTIYLKYLDACKLRDVAVDRIQELPKLDIGFS
jgi:hypothetical protein